MRFTSLIVLVVLGLLAACSAGSDATPAPSSVRSAVAIAPTVAASPTIPPSPTIRPATSTPTIAPSPPATAGSQPAGIGWSYPMGAPGRVLGDGFFIRHGFAVENTWYNPGYWHTGEDWYAQRGESAGTQVYAVADGEVVYADANYPGRVVIIKHADNLYSMYGHLDPALAVKTGQRVGRGDPIGVVFRRTDKTPSHLHFEIRTFVTANPVNGDQPRYDFRCGRNCAPGPGYWPIKAPDLPGAVGWRNPTHVITRRAYDSPPGAPLGEVVVPTEPLSRSITAWSAIDADGKPQPPIIGTIDLVPGARFPLRAARAGPDAPRATSAESYRVWYQIALPDGRAGWVAAAVPSMFETGSDGRPSSIRFNLLPAIKVSDRAPSG